ncbi:MAG: phenylalanine--tRNA ligase subunit alpha [Rickettsiales bacterium]|nr:phenylalanine--tRNA ligase subunit alpha [Rickettsiales bacterium]
MSLEKSFALKLDKAKNLQEIEQLRLEYLGKKGLISNELAKLGQLEASKRKEQGQKLNIIKQKVTEALNLQKTHFENLALQEKIATEAIDISLPSRQKKQGSIHPVSKVIFDIVNIFEKMGFTPVAGPEIEDEEHNFDLLNIGKDHPARQMHDSFYFKNLNYLLRTHTSSVQIRTMASGKPPFAIIAPGKTYRSDSDATHTPMFHQIEALYIAENSSISELKYVINKFSNEFFAEKLNLRFRSSFFPFTEPSYEVDIGCKIEKDHIDLKGTGDFLEIMGCGMVHPQILKNLNIDPKKYSGFALGMGVERIAMLKYGMRDLREFFNSKTNWLDTYNFKLWEL